MLMLPGTVSGLIEVFAEGPLRIVGGTARVSWVPVGAF